MGVIVDRMTRSLRTLSITLLILLVGRTGVAGEPEASPYYLIEAVKIAGNHKTKESVIRQALIIRPGDRLSIDDPLFEVQRYRVLSLGFFSEVRLELRKGSARGKVVLVVEVRERGTLLVSDMFFGTSEATTAWGGLGVSERNFLGRGIGLDAAFVLGSDPDVVRSQLQQAYWLGINAPRWSGARLELSSGFLFLDGNEFFRRAGSDGSSNPTNFISTRYRRIGGFFGAAFDVGRFTRLRIEQRGEAVSTDIPVGAVRQLPSGQSVAIPFSVIDGSSVLSVASLGLERDTRSDPVLPERGSLLNISADMATRLLGSDYSFVKLSASYAKYMPLPWSHVLAVHLFGGAIFGDAPFFEKFFIGDLSDLVPRRALGLNFSTLPSRNIFGTSINRMRYEEVALRLDSEYVIPWFRGGSFVYAGDFFIDVGVFLLASRDDLKMRDGALASSIPVDLTVDAGLRLDTRIGIFIFSIGNALGRIPF